MSCRIIRTICHHQSNTNSERQRERTENVLANQKPEITYYGLLKDCKTEKKPTNQITKSIQNLKQRG